MQKFPPLLEYIRKVFNRATAYAGAKENQLQVLLFAIIGLIMGLVISGLFIALLLVLGDTARQAREMGIISKTILEGYSKSAEVPRL
jgi:uncharacterized protein YacL